jgi:tetratricopeptide (TPR) repeat protein
MRRIILGSVAFLMLTAGSMPSQATDAEDCASSNYDLRLSACSRIIEKGSKDDKNLSEPYRRRGFAYQMKGEHDRAITDFNEAIRLNPQNARAYNNRGSSFRGKREYDRAISDHNEAIRLDPYADAYNSRGITFFAKGDRDQAVADFSKAVELDPKNGKFLVSRGRAFEAMNDKARALVDYQSILALPAVSKTDKQRQEITRQRIERLTQPGRTTAAAPLPQRVALVIGNSNYSRVGPLPNPANDAGAVAGALRRLGFTEVMERHDLNREMMAKALKEFGDRAEGAEWAVVFFAGHGMEMAGETYIIPTDAELSRDTHVADEALSLTQVQAKVDAANKFGLVILDSCRNNPFLKRMVRSGGAARAIGRGLAVVEPEGNVLVAYSAKHGTLALDGTGKNSPFTEALLGFIEEPGLEIGLLFRKVRDEVRKKTEGQQEPFMYGSLSSELLYFKPPRPQ